ncbi:lantibiotic dehydratase [Streptosporangium saharense]|uniref:lantibiotic dehydratase n=1 Tax=Streptosporangium saharense TaxID=1706840 RepID=UPI0036CBF90F
MFRNTDAALIRAAAYPHDLVLPAWPDLTTDQPAAWLDWLRTIWALPEFPTAVASAAPELAARIAAALADEPIPLRRLRRLVEATIRYLLRWTTRATPFGRFAGVAPLAFAPRATIRWGDDHHDTARPDDRHIGEWTAMAEKDLPTLRTIMVVANGLGYTRGHTWVLPCARTENDRVWDIEIDLTEPVRVAIEAARAPINFAELTVAVAEKLATSAPGAEALLAALVGAGALLSQVRPPMTVTDPAEHVARYIDLPAPEGRILTDRRIDCTVTLPPSVVREAQDTAAALVAVAPRLPGWAAYHLAFTERWGPGAAVPLREVLSVLGYPGGYRGAPRCTPPAFTDSDALLISLAQQSAQDGCAEVLLDDDLMERLRGEDCRPPIPHTELRFTLAADTPQDLDQGTFTLTVISGARHAGVAAARFLHLLTPPELDRFRSTYRRLPTAMPGAQLVQLSGPPLNARLATLARTPELLPVLPVGDFHPDPHVRLEDLAVAGDAHRLWLVSLSTGRPIEPLLVNCVLLSSAQQPLIRFLTEIWTAWNAPCMPFDWGYARSLPFLPRIRRGRSILHPARWIIPMTALPDANATWPRWRDAWQRYREHHRLPQQVLIGDDDVRLHLDLDENTHLALLRSHLDRHATIVLTEAPGPSGWIDGRPAELLLTLTSTPPHTPAVTMPVRPANALQHRPGQSPWLEARFHGPADHILAYLAETSDLPGGFWFLRYPHPSPHLRLRIPLSHVTFADAAHALAQQAEQLHNDGLLTDYALATYRPETRYGTGQTLAAAEAVFAADSAAVLRRLSDAPQTTTAAGMLAIAHAFTGDGPRWFTDHAPRHSGPRLDPAQLAATRRPHHDHRLADALIAYRVLADRDGLDLDRILGSLLHLHHARVIGVDLTSERHCLRLARAVAQTDLARRIT